MYVTYDHETYLGLIWPAYLSPYVDHVLGLGRNNLVFGNIDYIVENNNKKVMTITDLTISD